MQSVYESANYKVNLTENIVDQNKYQFVNVDQLSKYPTQFNDIYITTKSLYYYDTNSSSSLFEPGLSLVLKNDTIHINKPKDESVSQRRPKPVVVTVSGLFKYRPNSVNTLIVDQIIYEDDPQPLPKIPFNESNYQPVTTSQLDQTPILFNNKRIVVESQYTTGFEQSTLDPRIWIKYTNETIEVNRPVSESKNFSSQTHRVTIYGQFEHDPVRNRYGYGHLGAGRSQLSVDKIIYHPQ